MVDLTCHRRRFEVLNCSLHKIHINRLSPISGIQKKICSRRESLDKNWTSELPDDILLHVLSYLTMKEAGRTSLLSKRWRRLWSCIPTLNFDSCNVLHEISLPQKVLEVECPRYKSFEPDKHTYIRWVDQVVRSHNTPTINEFWVQCHLQEDSRNNIDSWVRFAMERGVKRLGMDIIHTHFAQNLHYTLPTSSLSNLLISLELTGLNVTGEALETFLCNCSALEFLSVSDSRTLIHLKVVGQSLKLKYLIIFSCFEIETLEISAPNLVYVNYYGPILRVPFENNPNLSEISIGGEYCINVVNNFMQHSSYLCDLEALTLMLPCSITHALKSTEFPEWKRLKKLDVRVDTWPDYDLLCMKSLITACPFLYKLVLRLNLNEYVCERILSRIRWQEFSPHYHLKVVEIVGFHGTTGLELAMYLLDIVVSLEKMIIDPCFLYKLRNPREMGSWKVQRDRAKQLAAYLKPGTDLIIFYVLYSYELE